ASAPRFGCRQALPRDLSSASSVRAATTIGQRQLGAPAKPFGRQPVDLLVSREWSWLSRLWRLDVLFRPTGDRLADLPTGILLDKVTSSHRDLGLISPSAAKF